MKGQWIGRTKGEIEGKIIINIDDLRTYYSGVAYLFPDNKKLPTTASFFRTIDKNEIFSFKAFISPINPRNGLTCEWKDIIEFYPNITLSTEAFVSGYFEENELYLNIKTNIGTKLESKIIKKTFTSESNLKYEIKSWEEYKHFVSNLLEKKYLYRGQQKPWKLRTAYHRKGRYDLNRFLSEDIPKLHQHLSSRITHVFNLSNHVENGAFFSLVQHHGYPTPLLDWTYSPYVAAFFAFRNLPKENKGDNFVRILIFDQEKWKEHWMQLHILNTAAPHLSIIDFLAIENERLIPQQAVTTVTNIDDIELYIQEKETETDCKYLTGIDIPYSEREKVMKELSFMGITAGSMFPGLDGACEELREKLFTE